MVPSFKEKIGVCFDDFKSQCTLKGSQKLIHLVDGTDI